MATPLSSEAIETALGALPGWTREGDKLVKSWRFNDFKQALSFLVHVGLHAECRNHHPEIHNVYSTVKLSLSTHDAGNRITDKDVGLARIIEELG